MKQLRLGRSEIRLWASQNFSYFDEPEVDHNGCVESEKFARMMDDITLQIFPARGHAWPGSLLHWMNIYCFMKPLKSCIQLSRPSDWHLATAAPNPGEAVWRIHTAYFYCETFRIRIIPHNYVFPMSTYCKSRELLSFQCFNKLLHHLLNIKLMTKNSHTD